MVKKSAMLTPIINTNLKNNTKWLEKSMGQL
jgi:hypothetical protein